MNRVKELRKMHRLSQRELAEKIFVNQTAVSQWERGATNPSTQTAEILADFFNVSVDYLLGRDDIRLNQSAPASMISDKVIKTVESAMTSNDDTPPYSETQLLAAFRQISSHELRQSVILFAEFLVGKQVEHRSDADNSENSKITR